MTTLSLDCGSQESLRLLSTKNYGADEAPFSWKNTTPMRELVAEIKCMLERYKSAKEIAHKLKIDINTVEQIINTITVKGVIQ